MRLETEHRGGLWRWWALVGRRRSLAQSQKTCCRKRLSVPPHWRANGESVNENQSQSGPRVIRYRISDLLYAGVDVFRINLSPWEINENLDRLRARGLKGDRS